MVRPVVCSLCLVSLSALAAECVAPRALEPLPLGSIRAEGWLRTQLEKQRDGLTGHGEEVYDDIGHSDWLTGGTRGGQYNWERGPYYAKGLVALALTLDDAALRAKAQRWVDTLLASQRANGDFGPKNDNWWSNMIALHLLRDWCEATGDARLEPFLRRYFAYQAERLKEHPLISDSFWAACRGGDELEVVLWLYDRTKDETLLDFAKQLLPQVSDWTSFYYDGGDGAAGQGYRLHIVNFMQGLKFPALKSRLTRDARDANAYDAAFDADGWAMRMHGRPDRMVSGTEPLSGHEAAQGTELCAIAERILSCRDVISVTGNVRAADDLERVAFNCLPATVGDDGRGLRYYLILNQPACTTWGKLGFECCENGGARTPGPEPAFGCCRSNFHFAWPKFVSALWMAKEGGLAAVAYAPSVVKTGVAEIRTSGTYPFGDEVKLEILNANGKSWPLFVRVPAWASGADIAVNGVSVNGAVRGRFCRLDRAWKAGDVVTLTLPAEIERIACNNDSVALRRGPLLYSCPIAANITSNEVCHGFAAREYRPAEKWNRALVLGKDLEACVTFVSAAAAPTADPFVHGAHPCALRVEAGYTTYAGWGTFRPANIGVYDGRPVEPPPSPLAASRVTDRETVDLVPLGATQIRITEFPWTAK